MPFAYILYIYVVILHFSSMLLFFKDSHITRSPRCTFSHWKSNLHHNVPPFRSHRNAYLATHTFAQIKSKTVCLLIHPLLYPVKLFFTKSRYAFLTPNADAGVLGSKLSNHLQIFSKKLHFLQLYFNAFDKIPTQKQNHYLQSNVCN